MTRPLDFVVISDHSEALGIMAQVFARNPMFQSDPTLARWGEMMRAGGAQTAQAMNEMIGAQAIGKLPPVLTDPKVVGPVMQSVWQQYTAIADKYNEPGKFTTLIGYEWTPQPGGDNLHRNVIFRDGKGQADQIIPFSSWNSENPEDLWAWMEGYEQRTGGKIMAIPHNANLSNGRMFEGKRFDGTPLTREYAERRTRWEPIHEIVQIKGASESHPMIAPTDEFIDYGIAGWDLGNLTLSGPPLSKAMMPTNYFREGLKRGIEHQGTLGVNPFKFGVVGASDVHNAFPSVDEANFFGKFPSQEPSPDRWEQSSTLGGSKIRRYTWQDLAAGYAAVWATDNTREAIWEAFKRKETYATSGTRMVVRFFGGYDFMPADATSPALAEAGYAKGVSDGRRPRQGAGGQGTNLPHCGAERPAGRQPRPHPGRQGMGRRLGQGAGEDLRRGMVREPEAGQGRQAAAGRRHGERGQGHVDQHDRRARAVDGLEGPGVQGRAAGGVLRTRDRDSDAALDGLRPGALRRQDEQGGAHEGAGARLDVADLVHAGMSCVGSGEHG